jgi:hypothetical protein
MSEIKITCETIHQHYKCPPWLKNTVEFLFRTPQSRKRAWQFVGWLKRNKYIYRALRGKLVWEKTIKEEL